MVTKVETGKQDMFKGQQMRPRVTDTVPFHCTQNWRTSSPVWAVGKANVILKLTQKRDLLGNKRKSPRDSLCPGRNS